MQDKALTTIKRLKVLQPNRDGAFTASVVAARREHDRHHRKHLLHERLVYSLLAYRSRNKCGATVAEITKETALHKTSVKHSLRGLSDLIHNHDGKWYANEPPEGWFAKDRDADHWSDTLRYTMLYLPRKGATINNRRFTLNHSFVFSLVVSFTRKWNPTDRVSIALLSTLLHDMNRKTVARILGDFVAAEIITCDQRGARQVIKRLPLTEHHLTLFEPHGMTKRTGSAAKPKATRPVSNKYEFKGDGFDAHRRACEGLIPQSYAEEAVVKTKQLSLTLEEFHEHLQDAKSDSDKNVIDGKCLRPNLGRFFVNRLETLLKEQQRIAKEAEAEQKRDEYLNSREYKEQTARRYEEAGADPMHEWHEPNEESVLARVRFSENAVINRREYDGLIRKLHQRCSAYVAGKKIVGQSAIDATATLKRYILKPALKAVNHHYRKDTFASAEEFTAMIDSGLCAIDGMSPLNLEVAHA